MRDVRTADALEGTHTRLRELNLSENQISETAAKRLLLFAKNTPSLQKLNLVGTCCGLCVYVLCVYVRMYVCMCVRMCVCVCMHRSLFCVCRQSY